MAFSNRSIKAPVPGKPHLVLREGYWRVSSQAGQSKRLTLLWKAAHDWIFKKNSKRPW